MQKIECNLRVGDVRAIPVDVWNQPLTSLPAISRGVQAQLDLSLFSRTGEPIEGLSEYNVWDFAIADDWDIYTPPIIVCEDPITVIGHKISIPLTQTNTEQLIASIGTSEQITAGCELVGRTSAEAEASFIIQFDITIRNRRYQKGGELPSSPAGITLPDIIPVPPPAFDGTGSINDLFYQVAALTRIMRGE